MGLNGRAARRTLIISDVSMVEGWLMARLEATIMGITNNHFKKISGLFVVLLGQITSKTRPKKG